MKKTIFKMLLLLVIIVIGIYYIPAPKRDFFTLYAPNDQYAKSLKEFQSRNTAEVIVDGIKWTYYSGGKGSKTIVFLHGMGGSYDLWWQQINEFENEYRVISYTLPEDINSLAKSAKGILAILEKEHVTSFIVVGTSMGGYIAQYLVQKVPERIEKVVFGNTFCPNNLIKQENIKKEKIIPKLPEILLVKLADKSLEKEIIPAGKNSELLAAFLPSIPFSKKQFMNRYAVVIDVFALNTSNYSYKRIPKLIIESDNDPLIHKTLRRKIKNIYADAAVYTFHNAGHFPYINEAKEYNTVLRKFLEKENEYLNVEKTIQNYFIGRKMADVKVLKTAFAANAQLFTNQDEQIKKISLGNYFDKVTSDGVQQVTTTIIDGDLEQKIASFKTQFSYTDKTYIDYLSLIKRNDTWKITTKNFIKIKE